MNRLNTVTTTFKKIAVVMSTKKTTKPFVMACAFALTSIMAPLSQAEDIEIYLGLADETSSEVAEEFQPNLLFVLDTSGSMQEPEVVASPLPGYDPSVDYGNSDNTNIYIYDDSRTYTGMFVPESNNSCNAATEQHAASPSFPEYFDKALVWRHQPEQFELVEDCSGSTSFTLTDTNVTRNRVFVLEDEFFEINAGQRYDFTFSAGGSSRALVDYFNAGGNSVSPNTGSVCENIVSFSRNNSFSCSITIPSNSSVRQARIRYVFDSNTNSTSRKFVSVDVSTGACINVLQSTGDEIADWFVSVDTNEVDEIEALECEADDGNHGVNSGSSEVYPQAQEALNTSGNPNYTSVAINPNRIVWSSDEYLDRYLFPGNYHDYLQSSPADLLGTVEIINLSTTGFSNPTSYCKSRVNNVYVNTDDYLVDDGFYYYCQSRIGALKEATNSILSSLSGARVGMMRFNNNQWGSVINAVQSIDSDVLDSDSRTHQESLIRNLLALPAAGSTPIQETLNEARRYFGGLEARQTSIEASKRIASNSNSTVDIPSTTTTSDIIVDPAALQLTGSQTISNIDNNDYPILYNSPITSECQDNNIILLSDGLATSDTSDVSEIETFSGRTCDSGNGGCLGALANGMANRDVNNDVNGDNRIYLHTVAFGSDVSGSTQLLDASNSGLRPGNVEGDQHYEASTAGDLLTVFQSIIRSLVRVESDSFVAPAVAVNAFNRLQFREDLYFAIFEPNITPRWNGNIKKYRINSDAQIVDRDGQPAVDDTGFFQDTARSFWSAQDDGSTVTSGGFAGRLDLTPARQLYANIDGDDENNPVVQLTENNFLTQIDDTTSSTVTTIGERGTDVNQNRIDIVKWSLGIDIDSDLGGQDTDPNFFVGETLHSSPYVLDFGELDANGDLQSEDVVITLTNQGMVHAIDGADDSGDELWAYIPDPSLFSNLGDYYNNVSGASHTYGLDGQIAFDVEREAITQEITKANIFVGQRRGGEKYFGMDISNARLDKPSEPPVSKLWTIEDLPRMAQSWATPVLAKINFCPEGDTCEPTEVLVISGGYDPAYDDFEDASGNPISVESRAGTVNGNAIYIVDRATGELLWIAGRNDQADQTNAASYYTNIDMVHSFPTEPTVVDADFDGVADLMFVVDIAGRVWRFDFRGNVQVDNSNTPSNPADDILTFDTNDIVPGNNNTNNEVSGGIIADLSEPGVDRRFYNHVDVSITSRTDDDLARYNIITGSGYRAHPRASEDAANRLYFIFDRNLQFPKLTADSNGVVTGITYDYVDADSDDNIGNEDLSTLGGNLLDSASTNRHGFYVELINSDEKLINPTITNDGVVLAVSYSPTADVTTAGDVAVCQRDTGVSFLYQITLNTGEASVLALDSDGISAQPLVIEVPDGSDGSIKVLVIGSEAFKFSDPAVIEEDGDIDKLISPGGNPSKAGDIEKVNWWERARTLVE